MKKYLRIIAIVMCVAVIGSTLCSCTVLDDAKDHTVVFTDDSHESFIFHGNNYKLLKGVTNDSSLSFILYDAAWNYHITDPDVPVLLSSTYGKSMVFDEHETQPQLIAVMKYSEDDDLYTNYVEFKSSSNSVDYYVREDKYDVIIDQFKSAKVDHLYISVYEYDDETEPWNGGSYKKILLDDEAMKAVENTLKNGEQFSWSDIDEAYWETMELYSCDKDILVTDGRNYEIIVTEGYSYYINDASPAANSSIFYKVAPEDAGALNKLCKEYAEKDRYTEDYSVG